MHKSDFLKKTLDKWLGIWYHTPIKPTRQISYVGDTNLSGKAGFEMTHYFENLVRSNYRFGRMCCR